MERYEKTLLFFLQTLLPDLKNTVILDIAGGPTQLNRHLLAQGVAAVHAVNLDPLKPTQTPPAGYHHHQADARALPAELPLADAVTASSALEHLSDLDVCLKEAFRKLKPGGLLVMHGGALWPCNLGHHLYTIVDQRPYFFGQPSDPMPRWGHLAYTEAELSAELRAKGVPDAHVPHILDQVHRVPSKNRRSASQLKQEFLDAGQAVVGFTEYRWGTPRDALLQRIRDRGHAYSLDDLSTGELVAVVRKWP